MRVDFYSSLLIPDAFNVNYPATFPYWRRGADTGRPAARPNLTREVRFCEVTEDIHETTSTNGK